MYISIARLRPFNQLTDIPMKSKNTKISYKLCGRKKSEKTTSTQQPNKITARDLIHFLQFHITTKRLCISLNEIASQASRAQSACIFRRVTRFVVFCFCFCVCSVLKELKSFVSFHFDLFYLFYFRAIRQRAVCECGLMF